MRAGAVSIAFFAAGLAGCSSRPARVAAAHEEAPLLMAPAAVSFGKVRFPCAAEERVVTGFNVSGAPATVGEITVAPAGDFTIVAETGTLSADESGTFTVRYQPKEAGADAAKISIAVEGHAPIVMDVSGEAAAAAVEEERFTQGRPSPVEVLFVVDAAPSMAEERAALGHAMAELLPASLPHHATTVPIAADADGTRRGLEVGYHAVSGWLREHKDVRRAVVFASDEDDQSIASRDHFAGFFRAAGVTVHAVVSPDNLACADAQFAARYVEVAQKTGGAVVSVCDPSWSALGSALAGLKSRFPLSGNPSEGTLEVRVDGDLVEGWTLDGGAIVFPASSLPPAGSTITARYAPACAAP